MADRFWVGGTGTWNTTSTTNWSATSGGAAGASVPTVADSVFFNQAATYTVTMTGALACLDITVSAGTVTFATGTGPTLNVRGSMSLIAGTVWSSTGAVTFSSTVTGRTVTTNSVSIAASFTFNGVGGGWTMGSALVLGSNSSLQISAGTFATGGFALTALSITSSTTSTRGLNLGASTVTLTGTNPINISSTTGLTFTRGTSLINCTSTGTLTFTSPGLTFYDVSFTGVPTVLNSTRTISGVNTFRNITFTPYTTATNGALPVVFADNQTITGTWTGSGASEIRRIYYRSSVLGTKRTISLTSPQTISNADFRDLEAGTSAITATGGGNCGGNNNITGFPAAKTVYWNLTGSQDWSATGWATTSNGTPAAANFPLAQDTAIFDNAGAATTVSTTGSWNMGTVNMSGRTTAMNFTVGGTQNIYGNWSFGTGVTVTSGSGSYSFVGRGNTQLISCAGKSFGAGASVDVSNIGGIVRLSDAFTTSAGGNGFLVLSSGTLDLVSFTATCGRLFVDATGSGSRTIAFGTGNITATLTGGGTAVTLSSTNFTRTGTPTINVSYAGAAATTITVGTGWTEANVCSFNFTAGTYTLTFLNVSSNACLDVSFTGFAGTWNSIASSLIYGSLTLSTGMTLATSVSSLLFSATTTGKTITTSGKQIAFELEFAGVGGSWVLQDALTMASVRFVTHRNGTLDLNGKTLTTGSSAAFSTATGIKNLTFNGGTLVCTAASTSAFNNAAPSGFTTTAGTGTGTISMTAATAKTFVGGGSTFNCTINQGGAGALTITGSSTFNNITNTTQPASILFTAGTTTTFNNFNLNGIVGSLITIGSVTAASHTLSKASGTVSANYLSISRSSATGGAAWYAGANSTDGLNNTGWIFAAPPVPLPGLGFGNGLTIGPGILFSA
jgi:hypothetical protein